MLMMNSNHYETNLFKVSFFCFLDWQPLVIAVTKCLKLGNFCFWEWNIFHFKIFF